MVCVVLVPVYNEPADRIEQTLASAFATPGVDLVRVIDDGSLEPVALSPRPGLEILRCHRNGGPSAALNAGLADLPDDSVICRLDVGDAYHPEAKARQIAEVAFGACRASASPYYDGARNMVRDVAANWRSRIYYDCQFSTVTAVYRRSAWTEIGGFDSNLRWCEDWLFTMRVHAWVGWRIFPDVTCTAGEYPGGHSDVTTSPERKLLRDANYAEVARYGMALAHPDRFRHLYDPGWCRKHNRVPLTLPKSRA